MTSEQAAQLIDHTLALVHDRLQLLQAQGPEQRALAAEFREWAEPKGGCIDLRVELESASQLAATLNQIRSMADVLDIARTGIG